MKNLENFVKNLIELMGFDDYAIEIDEEHRHGKILIRDNPTLVKENLQSILDSINHLVQLIAKKENQPPAFFDINNYRRERETIITELARAAARKAAATKEEIALPAMNSYERRIIHVELASRPDVSTESMGVGRARYVVIRPIDENNPQPKKEIPPEVLEENDNEV
ncbi:MAG: R3H domain-containing nucleic acid-binding protein [Candidatus Liptonbacteria bacterium]|nr:R3H domain-containing nucleic acid-binding protein [Candidatus Liptonbacteria bacterium]